MPQVKIRLLRLRVAFVLDEAVIGNGQSFAGLRLGEKGDVKAGRERCYNAAGLIIWPATALAAATPTLER